MKLTILCTSKEEMFPQDYLQNLSELETFSGKAAGVCYMPNQYFFNSNVTNPDKAKSRFNRVSQTGHHSISDHSFVTVLFEKIPKMTAMILNSLGFYNTSEKSGRYTIMDSNEEGFEKNLELYNKWKQLFEDCLIKKYDPNMDDKLVNKLALENARYMLSVFSHSTTMVYTTSLRMWSYIRQWCKCYIDIWEDKVRLDLKKSKFNDQLLICVKELYEHINRACLYSDKIVDNKGRGFAFLSKQVFFDIDKANECFQESYLIKYKTSFVDLAQQQRHRTLDYFMSFDGLDEITYYVPKIIRDTEFEKEWISDLQSIKDTFPLATKVNVIETGFIFNFFLKCTERLCGRVQLETMETIINNLHRFSRQYHKSDFMREMLQKCICDGNIKTKCQICGCHEPCYWGPNKAKTRLI